MKFLSLALAALLTVGTALAHHSPIVFDRTKQVTLTGIVTEWVWKNPHCFVMFDVPDEQGKTVAWGAETHPTTFLVRNEVKGVAVPLSATSIKPGDRVTVTLFPSRAGSPRGCWPGSSMPAERFCWTTATRVRTAARPYRRSPAFLEPRRSPRSRP